MRLNAEYSSRPRTPSPLCEGGGGVAKHTKTFSYPLSPSRKEMPVNKGIKETFNGSFIWSLMEEKEHFTRM